MISNTASIAAMQTISVIIADDMPRVRQDLRTVLLLAGQAFGTPVEILGEAENGRQAVEKVISLQPDVILMDLEMPVLDGYRATKEIKAAFPSTRVIVLTVHDDPAYRMKALQAGADDFLVKGVPVAEIICKINSLAQKGEPS
jgi:DNA-binding NarL/FixJ family response regulator